MADLVYNSAVGAYKNVVLLALPDADLATVSNGSIIQYGSDKWLLYRTIDWDNDGTHTDTHHLWEAIRLTGNGEFFYATHENLSGLSFMTAIERFARQMGWTTSGPIDQVISNTPFHDYTRCTSTYLLWISPISGGWYGFYMVQEDDVDASYTRLFVVYSPTILADNRWSAYSACGRVCATTAWLEIPNMSLARGSNADVWLSANPHEMHIVVRPSDDIDRIEWMHIGNDVVSCLDGRKDFHYAMASHCAVINTGSGAGTSHWDTTSPGVWSSHWFNSGNAYGGLRALQGLMWDKDAYCYELRRNNNPVEEVPPIVLTDFTSLKFQWGKLPVFAAYLLPMWQTIPERYVLQDRGDCNCNTWTDECAECAEDGKAIIGPPPAPGTGGNVSQEVTPGWPVIDLTGALSFIALEGDTSISSVDATIKNVGAEGSLLNWATTLILDDALLLKVTAEPHMGALAHDESDLITVGVDISGLAVGSYSGWLVANDFVLPRVQPKRLPIGVSILPWPGEYPGLLFTEVWGFGGTWHTQGGISINVPQPPRYTPQPSFNGTGIGGWQLYCGMHGALPPLWKGVAFEKYVGGPYDGQWASQARVWWSPFHNSWFYQFVHSGIRTPVWPGGDAWPW